MAICSGAGASITPVSTGLPGARLILGALFRTLPSPPPSRPETNPQHLASPMSQPNALTFRITSNGTESLEKI